MIKSGFANLRQFARLRQTQVWSLTKSEAVLNRQHPLQRRLAPKRFLSIRGRFAFRPQGVSSLKADLKTLFPQEEL
jgi:hypothetical protein